MSKSDINWDKIDASMADIMAGANASERAILERFADVLDLYKGALYDHEKAQKELSKLKDAVRSLFEKIKHGDQEHQDWLKNAIDEHFKDVL